MRGFSAHPHTGNRRIMELNPLYTQIDDLKGRLEGLRGYL